LGSSFSLIATLLFFYILFDLFVYGNKGKKSPYIIKTVYRLELLRCYLNNMIYVDQFKQLKASGFESIEIVWRNKRKFSSIIINNLFIDYLMNLYTNFDEAYS